MGKGRHGQGDALQSKKAGGEVGCKISQGKGHHGNNPGRVCKPGRTIILKGALQETFRFELS